MLIAVPTALLLLAGLGGMELAFHRKANLWVSASPEEVLQSWLAVYAESRSTWVLGLALAGGGGLMLFYEPIEETRMGSLRVEMAKKAGANVIVTACPFCLINVADAIKTSGLEGKMEVIDIVELVEKHMVINN